MRSALSCRGGVPLPWRTGVHCLGSLWGASASNGAHATVCLQAPSAALMLPGSDILALFKACCSVYSPAVRTQKWHLAIDRDCGDQLLVSLNGILLPQSGEGSGQQAVSESLHELLLIYTAAGSRCCSCSD